MRALLLAAGLGTRLRPLTLTVPKCLVEIDGKPLLDHWLEALFAAGIERVLINTHWLAEVVQDHVARSPYRNRIDMVHEVELLGTGGTILANREWLSGGPFMVAHADNLTTFEVPGLLAAHLNRPVGCAITMLAFHTDAPKTCGILELDARNVVVAFHEKVENPPGNLANAAVYIFETELVDFITKRGTAFVDLSTEVLPFYLGRIFAVITNGYHRDIGSAEALARAREEFARLGAHR